VDCHINQKMFNMKVSLVASVCCLFIGGALAAEIFNCKEAGEKCRGLPKCCGDLVCSSEGKWNPFVGGTCGKCAEDGERCVKDDQCCKTYQCDKERMGDFNGYCRPTRPQGASCYTDTQCAKGCDKKWYKIYGTCA